jgi:hypothetical protein
LLDKKEKLNIKNKSEVIKYFSNKLKDFYIKNNNVYKEEIYFTGINESVKYFKKKN